MRSNQLVLQLHTPIITEIKRNRQRNNTKLDNNDLTPLLILDSIVD